MCRLEDHEYDVHDIRRAEDDPSCWPASFKRNEFPAPHTIGLLASDVPDLQINEVGGSAREFQGGDQRELMAKSLQELVPILGARDLQSPDLPLGDGIGMLDYMDQWLHDAIWLGSEDATWFTRIRSVEDVQFRLRVRILSLTVRAFQTATKTCRRFTARLRFTMFEERRTTAVSSKNYWRDVWLHGERLRTAPNFAFKPTRLWTRDATIVITLCRSKATGELVSASVHDCNNILGRLRRFRRAHNL